RSPSSGSAADGSEGPTQADRPLRLPSATRLGADCPRAGRSHRRRCDNPKDRRRAPGPQVASGSRQTTAAPSRSSTGPLESSTSSFPPQLSHGSDDPRTLDEQMTQTITDEDGTVLAGSETIG